MTGIAFAGLVLLAAALAGTSSLSYPAQDVRALATGAPIAREIAGGETHAYRIRVATHQFLRVSVNQRGVDVALRLLGPDSNLVVESDRPTLGYATERISCVIEAAGDYQLEVRASKKNASGRYEVKIQELRDALPQDEKRVLAEKYLAEGLQLKLQRKVESLRSALTKYEAALELYRTAGEREGEAHTLGEIGEIHISMGENQKALGRFEEALPVARSLTDRVEEGRILDSRGTVFVSLGEPHKALESYNQALKLVRARKDPVNEAITLLHIGNTYTSLSEYRRALDYYRQSLALIRDLGGNRGAEAMALHNIGAAYAVLGEHQMALEYFGQGLSLCREVKYPYGEAYALTSIGGVHASSGEPQKALEYLGESLVISRNIGAQHEQANILRQTGVIHSDLGESQKALELFGQALAICRSLGLRHEEAPTLIGIGSVYARLGERQKALEHFAQALALSRDMGRRSEEAAALYGLARTHRDNGNLAEAHKEMEAALAIIESVRTGVPGQELRTSYLASKGSYYEVFVDVLMRRHESQPSEGYDAMALQVSERARARGLLESLTEARANIRQGVDPALLERERVLQEQLSAKAERLTRVLSGKHDAEQAAAARKEQNAIVTQYQEVQAQIRATSPRYAALTQPAPLSLEEIRQQVLDEDTLLLEYALGEERSFLWAATKRSIVSFALPGQDKIEEAARRVHELLAVSHTRQRKREAELAAAELSQMLLGPVAGQLGRKRLLIVADGALQYVPFAALPAPAGGEFKSAPAQPLILDHEIVNLPSASVLPVLRREREGRQPATKMVAVLADPVLRSDDSRVKQARGAENENLRASVMPAKEHVVTDDLVRSARESGVTELERLPFTRQEAEAILSLARDEKNLKALDFNASRVVATSAELAGYRIVHFATHGLINSEHPHLSGIVLSLVDEQGRPQDGFLRAHDIYNLQLGANLVVLSACQTALGKQVKGEGLVGLVRGFMYAGVPRVAASLWDVKDEATAELMKRFYEKMLKEGMRPAAALRAAQVSMLKDKRWEAPYYWAGFVLQGEWR